MVNLRKTLELAHTLFTKNNVSHALIGGFAMACYGHFRATADIDFLVDGDKKDLVKKILTDAGFNLVHESSEVLQFTGIGYLDVLLANRPLSKEMLKAATENKDLGVHVLRPEDIIGLKIQAYKNDSSRELQDKADIQKLLSLKDLDLKQVQKYADLFGEWTEIQKLFGLKK
jgi:hypothetical protein